MAVERVRRAAAAVDDPRRAVHVERAAQVLRNRAGNESQRLIKLVSGVRGDQIAAHGPRWALPGTFQTGRGRRAVASLTHKKTPGRNPGASCPALGWSAMGIAVGLYPKPYAAPWDHDAVIKRRALRGATPCQIGRLRVFVPVAMIDAKQRDALGSREGPHLTVPPKFCRDPDNDERADARQCQYDPIAQH